MRYRLNVYSMQKLCCRSASSISKLCNDSRERENEKARENESHVRNINVMSYKNGHYANYTRKYWNISQSSSGVLGVATNVSKEKKAKQKTKKKSVFNVPIYAFTLSLVYSGFVCTDRVWS